MTMDKTTNDSELESLANETFTEEGELLGAIDDEEVKEKIANKLKTLEIQRLKAKEKAERLAKELEAVRSAENKKETKVVQESNSTEDEWKERIEFLIKRRDFDAEELEVVSAFAKGLNKPLEEAVKHPAVEGALKAIKEKKEAERATLQSSGRQVSGEEQGLLGKLKAGKLSPEEFKANFKQIQEEFFKSQKRDKSYE